MKDFHEVRSYQRRIDVDDVDDCDDCNDGNDYNDGNDGNDGNDVNMNHWMISWNPCCKDLIWACG